MDSLLHRWDTYGYILLPSALSTASVSALVAQLQSYLGPEGLALDNPQTLPAGPKQRRVYEVAPVGASSGDAQVDAAWQSLVTCPSLIQTLDALLPSWTLPVNTAREGVRHFYAPCTAPELPAVQAAQQQCLGLPGAAAPPCAAPSRVCPFSPMASWLAQHSAAARPSAASWAPVSRRRHVGTGWHLDVGPGVSPDAVRTLHTRDEHAAGAVLLVALSDWQPAEGGTAILPGSHKWVEAHLRASAAAGLPSPTHQQLNLHFAQLLRAHTEAGKVLLPSCACGAQLVGTPLSPPAHACAFADSLQAHLEAAAAPAAAAATHAPPTDSTSSTLPPLLHVQQLVCPAGSILLMHPLALHSGTLNLSTRGAVRLMLNGMARTVGAAAGEGSSAGN